MSESVRWFGLDVDEREDDIISSVVALNTARTGRPVFFVHDMFGDAKQFVTLAKLTPAPFYGIELRPTTPLSSMEALAHAHITAIRRRTPEGPYRLGGYSFGALLAIEMARQLESEGHVVESLMLVDMMPYVPNAPAPTTARECALGSGFGLLFDLNNTAVLEKVAAIVNHADDVDVLASRILSLIKSEPNHFLTAGTVGTEVLRTRLRVMLAFWKGLVSKYRPGRAVHGRATLVRIGEKHRQEIFTLFLEGRTIAEPHDLGVGLLCGNLQAVRVVDCSHFTLFARDSVGLVRDALKQELEGAAA